MTNNLEQDLIADGFTPSPLGLKGVVEWTGWTAPPEDDRLGAETTPNTYEMYYDLITDAMYAQMDDPPWEREHLHCRGSVGGRCPILLPLGERVPRRGRLLAQHVRGTAPLRRPADER